MKIFVTGASGFLGTNLCAVLEKKGHEVVKPRSSEANLKKAGSLSQFNSRFDLIFHLAAWTQAGDFCLYHPGEQWVINQQINTNVLSWWQESQPQAKLISIGTSCSYAPELSLTEENYLVGTPIDSLYTYAMTKRMMQVGLQSLSKQFGLKYLTVVPSTLYGTGYHTDGRQMHFIFDLIRKILNAKYKGDEVVLWGDGYQRRELVYVNDFVNILLQLIPVAENEIVNIGAGEEHTIREFAESICRIVNYDPALIKYDTSKYVGAKSKCLNVEKLRQRLPDYRLTALDQGLEKTVTWFKKAFNY